LIFAYAVLVSTRAVFLTYPGKNVTLKKGFFDHKRGLSAMNKAIFFGSAYTNGHHIVFIRHGRKKYFIDVTDENAQPVSETTFAELADFVPRAREYVHAKDGQGTLPEEVLECARNIIAARKACDFDRLIELTEE